MLAACGIPCYLCHGYLHGLLNRSPKALTLPHKTGDKKIDFYFLKKVFPEHGEQWDDKNAISMLAG